MRVVYWLVIGCLIALAVFLNCADIENPYNNTALTDVIFSDRGYAENEPVEIFSTFDIEVSTYLQTYLEKFVISAPGNRLFINGDTTVVSSSFEDDNTYSFQVSFYDTGADTIRLSAYLTDGTHISRMLVYNVVWDWGIDDNALTGTPGSAINLKTRKVKDNDVEYIWQLFGEKHIKSVSEFTLTIPDAFTSETENGYLYLRDTTNAQFTSDTVYFPVILADTKAPRVAFNNQNVYKTDSAYRILTNKESFLLQISAIDESGIKNIYANGEYLDIIPLDSDGQIFSAQYYIPVLNRNDSLGKIVPLTITDNRLNDTAITVHVVYDSLAEDEWNGEIQILKPASSPHTVNVEDFTIIGTIIPDIVTGEMELRCIMDGIKQVHPAGPVIISPENFDWQWPLNLKPLSNIIDFFLLDLSGGDIDTIATQDLEIRYNTQIKDIEGPSISEVKLDKTLLKKDKGYTESGSGVLSFLSYDELSGLPRVTVDDDTAEYLGNGMFQATVSGAHDTAGTVVTIKAVDRAGNESVRQYAIIKNVKPDIVAFPHSVSFAQVGETTFFEIKTHDADNDSCTGTAVLLSQSKAQSIPLTENGFTWTPAAEEDGVHRVWVSITDGFEIVERQFDIYVSSGDIDEPTFLNTLEDFPDTLVAGKDTLSIILETDLDESPVDLYYSATLLNGNGDTLSLGFHEDTLKCLPEPEDTGMAILELIAITSTAGSDTLYPQITVVPYVMPNAVAFQRPYSSILKESDAANTTFLVPLSITEPVAEQVSLFYSFASSNATQDSDFVILSDNPLRINAGDSTALIGVRIIDDSLQEGTENIIIVLDSVSGNMVIGEGNTYTFEIDDDETKKPLTVSFDKSSDIFQEEYTGATVKINLSEPADTSYDIILGILPSSTASYSEDYYINTPTLSQNKTITIKKWDTHVDVQLTIINDNVIEPDERIDLAIFSSGNGLVVGKDSLFTAIIQSDDSLSKPVIDDQNSFPPKIEVTVGDRISYTVTATGGELVYTWLLSGTLIDGADSSTYTIEHAESSLHGKKIQCIVENSLGVDTSEESVIIVLEDAVAPVITSQPRDTIVQTGNPVSMRISYVGTAPSFQWYHEGSPIAGAQESVLLIQAAHSGFEGNYWVEVSNARDTVISDTAYLTVVSAPVILQNITAKNVDLGDSVRFTVEADGYQLKYQWVKDAEILTEETETSLSIPVVDTTHEGEYFVQITDGFSTTVNSATVKLTVITPPVIKKQPANSSVFLNDSAFFIVEADQDEVDYRWMRNGAFMDSSNPTVTTHKLILAQVTAEDDNARFRCVVSNSAGADTSSAAILAVSIPPRILQDVPDTTYAFVGDTARFSVSVVGSNLSYKWYLQKNNLVIPIENETDSVFILTPVFNNQNGNRYFALIYNDVDSINSSASLLVIERQGVKVTEDPSSLTVAEGDDAIFSMNAIGESPLFFQWQKNGQNIHGATAMTYTFETALISDHGSLFRCIVWNNMGIDTSQEATLSVSCGTPTIVQDLPDTAQIFMGDTFRVTLRTNYDEISRCGHLRYAWFENDLPLYKPSSNSLVKTDFNAGDSMTYYCIISNDYGSVISKTLLLTVVSQPAEFLVPLSDTTQPPGSQD